MSSKHSNQIRIGDIVEMINKDGVRITGKIIEIPEEGIAMVKFEDGTKRRIPFQYF